MEPRARAARHKSSLNFGQDLSTLLYATGAPLHPDIQNTSRHSDSDRYLSTLPTANREHKPTPFQEPFPETLRVLDEIVTDFIIETCHGAVQHATYSGRTKLKYADFEWVIRRDAMKLGRVQEMFRKRKELDTQRKLFDDGSKAGTGGKLAVGDMIAMGEVVGEEGTGKGKGRGRGRRKKKDILADAKAKANANVKVDVNATNGTHESTGDGKAGEDVLSLDGDDDDDEPAAKRPRSDAG